MTTSLSLSVHRWRARDKCDFNYTKIWLRLLIAFQISSTRRCRGWKIEMQNRKKKLKSPYCHLRLKTTSDIRTYYISTIHSPSIKRLSLDIGNICAIIKLCGRLVLDISVFALCSASRVMLKRAEKLHYCNCATTSSREQKESGEIDIEWVSKSMKLDRLYMYVQIDLSLSSSSSSLVFNQRSRKKQIVIICRLSMQEIPHFDFKLN